MFFVAVSYAYYGQDKFTKNTQQIPQETLVVERSATPERDVLYEKDSDGDGLADWEEVLLATDPDNPDTDGDGVTDDKDTTPNNKLALAVGESDESVEPVELTSTQVVGRDAMTSIMASFYEGKLPNEQEQERIAQQAIQKAVPLIQPPQFLFEDIRIVPSNEDSVERYVRVVHNILRSVLESDVENEYFALSLMAHEENTDKEEGALMLRETLAFYNKIADELSVVQVPEDAALIHERMMNAILQYIYTFESILEVEKDPLRASVSLQSISSYHSYLNNAFYKFYTYANEHAPDVFATSDITSNEDDLKYDT
jgi:hypothetical protein